MDSYIENIILLLNDGSVRNVKFNKGINIIVGESKTGKSALIDIIDYCLFKKVCTIPKGKIIDSVKLYSLNININDKKYIVGRYGPNYNVNEAYFFREYADIDYDKITIDYFSSNHLMLLSEAQSSLEKALGLDVTDIPYDDKTRKASIRNMVSYLFQHQNLIANKFAMFYRFDDSIKKKDTIEQFPIFAGIATQEYYSKKNQLNDLNKQLRSLIKREASNKNTKEFIAQNLKGLIKSYYSLINKNEVDVPDDISKLIILAENLPMVDVFEGVSDKGILNRYNDLKNQLEEFRRKSSKLNQKKNELMKTTATGEQWTKKLYDLKSRNEYFIDDKPKYKTYRCPICGQNCQDIANEDNEVKKSMSWLENELLLTSSINNKFEEDIRVCNKELIDIEDQINILVQEIQKIEETYFKNNEITKKQAIDFSKSKILVYVDLYKKGIFSDSNNQIDKLKEEIAILENELKEMNIEQQLVKAEKFISDNITKLANKLEFEKDFEPLNFKFTIVDNLFDFYHEQPNGEKIHLNEMGSGSNWLNSHICLFLSLLRYFSSNKNSPMLLSLFLDQPTQVYFPTKMEENEADMIAVNNLFECIFDEVESIQEDYGVIPQVIITDHTDGQKLSCRKKFKDYTIVNWNSGKHLI